MKTSAFLIRVAICCLLSLIPMTELENRIYSARMELRTPSRATSNVVIVDPTPRPPNDYEASREIRDELRALEPTLILSVAGQKIPTDADGVVRRAALISEYGESSLAMLASREKIRGDLRKPHLINYAGPEGTIPRCRISTDGDAKNGLRICENLKGKIVLLAEDPPTASYRTPVGEMSVAEILANDVQTVVLHRPIYYASTFERILLIAAMTLLGAFYIIYYPVMISSLALSATGIGIVAVLFQLIFQLFSIYIPSANIGAALLITYLVFTGYRLAFQENLQWRALKQSQYARELEQMKSNFLTLVSHDIKTPVAKIQAVVERLRGELESPENERTDWRPHFTSIENSAKELSHYVTSVLNLSKIESQKVILNKRSNDINTLIEQALKRLQPLAEQRKIHLEKQLDPLFSVECDEDLMRQVLTNLIDNAIKYSPEGARVIVRSREEDGFIRVDVEDFGLGIPQNHLPLMFRKFSRALQPIHEQVKGSGLGLYLSKYFIELHGGKIRLKSTEGKGTTFTFTLPLSES